MIDELSARVQDLVRRPAPMREQGDVIIRNMPSAGFVVVDALSDQPLDGPFTALTDALKAARRLAITGTIWRQHVDERGQSMGDPIPIAEFRVLKYSKNDRSTVGP